ncbi:hypothetical protein G6699_07270 [Polynucleobacter paneuropaeus]|jgi:hypothetical protein|nr:hypothetical protein [Polynucleobacter paneuropaeus]
MTNPKQKMSASYKAIFILSIFMVFFVLIAGAANNSKSSGFGMWIWGYTAWLMYKRRNTDLVSFYKLLLWFDVIAAGVAVAVLSFSDSEVTKIVGYSAIEALVLFVFVISITYGLYKYFLNLDSNPTSSDSFSVSDSTIWDQVSEEVKSGKRVDSLRTRAFSESDGDSNKANARYIKLRFDQIKLESMSSSSSSNASLPPKETAKVKLTIFDFWNNFNTVGKLALIGILLLVGYGIFGGNMDPFYKNTYSSSSTEASKISEKLDVSSKQVSIFRKLNDGVLMRWSNDKECFINMKIDFSSSAIPVSLSKTNELKSQFFKELTQENLVIAVLYYDPNLSDDTVTKFINKDIFLKIKSMCQ